MPGKYRRFRMAIDPITFGARLRYWRTIRNWTPEEVARLAISAQHGLGIPGRPITAAWIRMRERGADGLLSSVDRGRVDILALVFDIPAGALAAPEGLAHVGHVEPTAPSMTWGDLLRWYQAHDRN